jgi:hypothetical protein
VHRGASAKEAFEIYKAFRKSGTAGIEKIDEDREKV